MYECATKLCVNGITDIADMCVIVRDHMKRENDMDEGAKILMKKHLPIMTRGKVLVVLEVELLSS